MKFETIPVGDAFQAGYVLQQLGAGHVLRESDLARKIAEVSLDNGRLPEAVMAADLTAALLRTEKAHQVPQSGCFARAVWA